MLYIIIALFAPLRFGHRGGRHHRRLGPQSQELWRGLRAVLLQRGGGRSSAETPRGHREQVGSTPRSTPFGFRGARVTACCPSSSDTSRCSPAGGTRSTRAGRRRRAPLLPSSACRWLTEPPPPRRIEPVRRVPPRVVFTFLSSSLLKIITFKYKFVAQTLLLKYVLFYLLRCIT